MFADTAMAQTTTPAVGGGAQSMLIQIAPILVLVVLFYMLLIRPQQRRAKAHQQMISELKRGDTVVLSNGMIGKVSKVEDAEVAVEIAQGVNVKVVKAMIQEVRARTQPAAANDAKS
jgi:preprotein translocase subunit YajC